MNKHLQNSPVAGGPSRKFCQSRSLLLNSKPENITLVESFVQQLRSNSLVSDSMYYNVLLVLTEAVNNSIFHGNGADPDKNVKVLASVKRNNLFLTVSDEGKGFFPEKLADPTSPERLTQQNGRGVFLMKQLSENVSYTDNGRKVEICFRIR